MTKKNITKKNSGKNYLTYIYIIALGSSIALGYYLLLNYKISTVLAGIIAFNISGLVFMCIDKAAARRGSFRIPEKVFFLLAALGGTIGLFLGGQLLRHKTIKGSFNFTLFIIFAIQILIIKTLKIKFY